MKKLLKNYFRKLGFDISRIDQAKQRREKLFPPLRHSMEASLQHLRRLNFYPDIIVDLGAANGTRPLQGTFPESRFLWIEPLMEYEPALKELCKKFKGRYIIAAAGSAASRSTIRVSPDLFGSTLQYKKSNVEQKELRTINIIRMDDKIESHNIKGKNILIKIDVQGFEIEALKGAERLLDSSEVVIIEVSLIRFDGQPEMCDVIKFMTEKGFKIYDMFDGHNRPLDGALHQKDLMFVKQNGPFRRTDQWATPEQVKQFHQLGKRISDS